MVLIVASLNVDSIVSFNRRVELEAFLSANVIDICLIQETKLDSRINFKINNYNTLMNDLSRGMGGTAILIRNCFSIRNPRSFNNLIQAISVDVLINNTWRNFSSVYISPGMNITYDKMLLFFKKHGKSFIGGDTNARNRHFGDESDNHYGILLKRVADKLNIKLMNPSSPTCFRSCNGSFIVKFINTFDNINHGVVTVVPSFSDHFGIITKLYVENNFKTDSMKRYDFDHANMEGFNKFLEKHSNEIVLPITSNLKDVELEAVISKYQGFLESAVKKFVPVANVNNKSRVILSSHTRALQRGCKNIQRKLIRNMNSPFQLKKFWILQIKNLKIMIRNSISYDTSKFFSNTFNDIDSNLEAFSVIKRFTGHKKRIPMGGSLFADVNNEIVIVGRENIANGLRDMFGANNKIPSAMNFEMDVFVKRDLKFLDAIDSGIKFTNRVSAKLINDGDVRACNEDLPFHQHNILTSFDEVWSVIQSRPNKKSTGMDNSFHTH